MMTASSSAVPANAWWQELGDSELDGIVAAALTANADVSIAAARVRQARALADAAAAARRPQLDLGTSAARERVPRTIFRDTQGTHVEIPPFERSRFGLQAEARYEIDLLGRLALGEHAAVAGLNASDADLRAVRQWLAREVVLTYADLRLADDRAAIARDAQAALERLRSAEKLRLQAGLIGRDRIREADRQWAEKGDERVAIAEERHAALVRLAGLSGKAPAEVTITARERYFGQLALSGVVAADLPVTVLDQRPDVAAAWQRVVAAHREAERVRLERYPALTLTGSTGFASEAIRSWLTGAAIAWVAQAALQGPLLDAGRNRARTDQAIAVMDEQLAQHRKIVVQALVEVETTLGAAHAGRARVELAEGELVRRAADREAASATLAAGLGSRPALLQAELALLDAIEAMSLRRHELLRAWVSAQHALGR